MGASASRRSTSNVQNGPFRSLSKDRHSAIKYQVIATNNVYNLVYPFYLQKSP